MTRVFVNPAATLAAGEDPVGKVIIASIWLIGILLAAFVVGAIIRRRLFHAEGESHAPFTLDDLRQMRERGDLSSEEYERAKAKLLEQIHPLRPNVEKTQNPPEKGPV